MLSSAKIGAAQAWMRRQGLVYDPAVMAAGFTLGQLLNGAPPLAETGEVGGVAPPTSRSPVGGDAVKLGVDIETIDAMPKARDLRTDPFYADNFTEAEIAYCLERRDPRESLCGLWAAKEAIRKLSADGMVKTNLKGIEISHASDGAPMHAGVALSISHAGGFAIAVAATAGAMPAPATLPTRADLALSEVLSASPVQAAPSRFPGLAALAVAVLALICALVAMVGRPAAAPMGRSQSIAVASRALLEP
jgi:phosphopantetheine--protein transferase-like protein